METNQERCGCGGKGKPLGEPRSLIAELERQEAIRKANETQAMLAALGRYVLDIPTTSIQGVRQ